MADLKTGMDLRGRRPDLKTPGMEVGSEIGLGFGEPGGTRAHQKFPGIFSLYLPNI